MKFDDSHIIDISSDDSVDKDSNFYDSYRNFCRGFNGSIKDDPKYLFESVEGKSIYLNEFKMDIKLHDNSIFQCNIPNHPDSWGYDLTPKGKITVFCSLLTLHSRDLIISSFIKCIEDFGVPINIMDAKLSKLSNVDLYLKFITSALHHLDYSEGDLHINLKAYNKSKRGIYITMQSKKSLVTN